MTDSMRNFQFTAEVGGETLKFTRQNACGSEYYDVRELCEDEFGQEYWNNRYINLYVPNRRATKAEVIAALREAEMD